MATLLKSLVPNMPDELSDSEQALLRLYEQMEDREVSTPGRGTGRESLGSIGTSPLPRDSFSQSPLSKRLKAERRESLPQSPLSPTLTRQHVMKQIAEGKLVINRETRNQGFKKTKSQERLGINRRDSYSGLSPPNFSPFLPSTPSPLSQDPSNIQKQITDEYRKNFVKRATLTSSFTFPSQEVLNKHLDEDFPSEDTSLATPGPKSDYLQISHVPPTTTTSKQVLSTEIIRQAFANYGKIKTLIDRGGDDGLFLLYEEPSVNLQVVNEMNNGRIMGIEILVRVVDKDKAPVELSPNQISQPWIRIAAGIKDTSPDQTDSSITLDSVRGENLAYKDSPFM